MRHNRLSLILILASLAVSLIASANIARPVSAVTNNSHVITSAVTSDHYIYESSYQNPGFYANGLYWVFYEDSTPFCEGVPGCFYYVTSSDGVSWSSPTQVKTINAPNGIHVTDSDWSVVNSGSQVFYARYNESSFDSDCNRALLFGSGTISGGSINWQAEQVVRSPSSTETFPNEVISVDSSGQVWIGYLDDSQKACGGTGHEAPHIIQNNAPLPPAPLSSSFVVNHPNATVSQSINFNATATGGKPGYNYQWNFGDGNSATGQNVTHAYLGVGTFKAVLETTDSASPSQIVNSTEMITVGLIPSLNQPPQLVVPVSRSVRAGSTVAFPISASDTDGESVTVTTSQLPGASFSNSTRQFNWTPIESQSNQTWTLTFNATDSGGLSVTRQVLINVSPQWSGDIPLPFSTLSQSISANWHIDIAALSGGQVYAGYWADKYPFFGRLFDGSAWHGEDGISLTSESTDVNSFIFGSGNTVYAVYFDTNKGTLNAGIKPSGQTWQQNVIGPGEAKSVCGLPGNVPPSSSCSNSHRYSLPYTATFDLTSGLTYVFWYNQTNNVVDEWSGSGASWRLTPGAFSTQPSGAEYPITSFHYSNSINNIDSWGIIWIDGINAPYKVNFALETVGAIPNFPSDASWNPLVHCTPVVVSIEQILGGQSNASSGGATESGSIFNPGILAKSPGDAKRWLTPSSFTSSLNGYQQGGPPCQITNADGQTVGAFVEIRGVQRGPLLNEDFSANFDPVNGGGPYPNLKGYYDTTFNIFTPGYDACTATNATGCMHMIHVEFDHDWKAAGYCGPGTVCDPYQIAQQAPGVNNVGQTTPAALIDVQGFIYWDPDHANEAAHAFSGWEIHPLTGWRLSCPQSTGVYCTPGYNLSSSPSVVTGIPGQRVNSTISINTFNLFSGRLNLTASVSPTNPSDPTVTLTPSTLIPSLCNACAAANSTLTIVPTSSSSGTYIVTVTTCNGSPQCTTTVTIQVQGFSLKANPQTVSIPAGQSENTTITLTSLGSFSGPVDLNATATGCACGFQTKFSPTRINLTVGGTATAILTITAGSTTGNAVITITGNSSSLRSSTTVSVSGVDFSVTSTPASANVLTNRLANSTIIIAGVNGFTGTVNLSDTVPTNLTCSLGPTSIQLNSTTTSGRSNLSCNGPPGNYTVIITALGNGVVHTTTFSIRVQDFTITAVPIGLEVNINSPGTSTIHVSAVNGFTGTIALSQNGGSACNLSAPSVVLTSTTTSASVNLSCTFTATGNTSVLVTSTFGPLIHIASVAFQVVDFTIAASPTTFIVNAGSLTNSTISLGQLNGFNRTVTLSMIPQSGLVCSLSSNSINLATSQTTAFLSCKSATAGNYSVTVNATNTNLSRLTSSIQVQVVDFHLTPNIPSLSLSPGQTTSTPSIHLDSLNGFTGTVTINVIISPSVTSGPTAIPGFSSVKLTSIGNSTSLTVNAGQIAGSYNLNITATNGQLTRWAIITLTVTSAKPTVATSLSASSILSGGSVTDSVVLTGTTATASGTVTYYLSSSGSCAGPASIISTVSVTNGVVPSSRLVFFNSTGTYGFNATYSGDINNAPASSHICESLTVQKDNPTIGTSLSPNTILVGQSTIDTATLSSFFQASGTINYNLFIGSNSCTGPSKTVWTVIVTNGIIPNSRSVQFNSTNSGGYGFQAAYSGDGNNTATASPCEPLTVNPVGASVTTNLSATTISVGGTVSDSATLSGETSTAGGTVTYNEFANGVCSAPSKVVSVATVTNGVVLTSRSVVFNSTGVFSFDAVYSGDANNNGATSACEPLTVNKASPTISTSTSPQTAITVGSSVTDQATITGGYPTSGVTGTVTYTLYSFSTLPPSTSPCSSGTIVGAPQTLAIGPSGSVPNSAAVMPTPAGFYGFSATYNGDGNNTVTIGNCEPLTVNKQTPTITTTINPTPPVVVGTSVTDQATIIGGFPSSGLTGSITYNYFSTNGVCSGTPTSSKTVSIGSANSVTTSGAQTPTSVGQYSFNATYNGDGNNNASSSTCEPLTVTPSSTAITTAIKNSAGAPISSIVVGNSAHDTAVITGSTSTASGTVTYNFYNNGICSGTPASIQTVTVANGAAPDSSVNTPVPAGPYSYNATYSGDTNNQGAKSPCEPLTVNKTTPTITTSLSSTSVTVGTSLTDSSTLTNSFQAGGTVTYNEFNGGTCTGTATVFSTATVSNGIVPNSGAITPTPAGSYSFNATYSGDANNSPAKSPCEPLTVMKVSPAIVTSISPLSTITVGASATDQATITGGYPSSGISGTVTYNFFNNGVCSGSPLSSQPVTIATSNFVPASPNVTPSAAGSYAFNATYNGDTNNNRVSSTCEPLTVLKASPTISTTIKNSSGSPVTTITVGTTVHDSASLTNGFSPVGGTVSYTFYTNGACTAPGTSAGTGTVTSGVVQDSSTETPLSPGSYSFNATYSGDQNNNGVSSTCETLTVNAKLTPTLTTTVKDSTGTAVTIVNVGSAVHDTVILSGGSVVITGSVTYYFFTNNVCSGPASTSFPPFPQTVTIGSSNSVPDSTALTLPAGMYSFNATYGGDSQNNVATSTCEPITVKASPTVGTVIKDSANVAVGSVTVGSVVHDTATLTGASSAASGSVTYTFFSNNACLGTGTVLSTASVTNAIVPDSATTTPSPAGSYSFNVSYTGDAINNPAKSPCEPLTVLKTNPTLTTAIKDSANSPVTTVTVGTVVHDTATLASGYLVSGTVTYTTFNNAACVSPGTVLGTPVTVTSGAVPDSSTITPQPAGPFSFNVTYSGDTNNNRASVCESLSVIKTTPILSTTISPSATIVVGSPVTDQATLTGGFPTAGITGTVTYNFFNTGTCLGTPVANQVVPIGPSNSVPQSSAQTPLNAGAYAFNATYSGDSNNNRATSTCEPLTVAKQTPTLTTTVNPSSTIVVGTTVTDQATITGGYPASGVTGTVTYNFFSNGACTGLPASSHLVIIASGNSVPSSNGQTPSPAGSFAFNATYNGDTNNNPVKSACEPFTVIKASPTVTTTISPSSSVVLGTSVTDHASLAGGYPLSGVTGSLVYRFFNNGACQGLALSSQTVTIGSGNSVPPSGSQTPTSAGEYSFNATYGGDLNNNVVTSTCEPLTITPPATSIITTIKDSTGTSLTSAVVGTSIHDAAVLTGSTAGAGGTVVYSFFNNGACTGSPASVQTVTVTNALVPDSSATVPTPAGSYSYNGTYSGDANNQPARGACEPLTINKATPSISTALSAGTIIVGKSASDSATVTGGFSTSGTVTFDVFSGGTCVGSPIASATLGLVSGSAGPSLVTFNSTGTFNWQATYNGDVDNNQVSSSCGSEPLTVQKITPTVSTTLSSTSIVVGNAATDSATLTGGFATTGTVTFNIYSGPLCTGTPVASKTATVASASAGPISVVFNSTANYNWQAIYNGDSNNNQASSACGSETLAVIKTTPSISTALSATTAPVNTSVSDTASVSGSFAPTGTVTFNVYTGSICSGTPIVTKILTLSGLTSGPASAVFNSTGTFNWQAVYNGDSNNNVATSTCGSESLTVQKVTPTVTTSLANNSIIVGGLSDDSASVTGGFKPTGTVTFNVYSGSVCTGTPTASKTASLIGTTAGPVSVALNSTGTFNWQAVYNGDGNNTIVSSTCGTETVTVAKSTPSVSTSLSTSSIIVGGSVPDTAVVSGGFGPTGTVTFSIFSGTVCIGTPVDSRTVALSISGSAGPVSFTFNAAGSYNWQAVYNGDSNNNPAQSVCGSEPLNVNKATPTITTTLSVGSTPVGTSVSDTATVSGGFGPTGSVTFNVYSGSACSGTPVASSTVPLSGQTAGPVTISLNATGTYNWQAVYNGDPNNSQAPSACGTETLTVTKVNPSVSTALSANAVVVGTTVSDTATVSGGFSPTGVVTFNVYSGSVCVGSPIAIKSAVISAGKAGPVSVIFNSTGVYNWQAVYNGDGNNNAAQSPCGTETVSVGGVLIVTTSLSTSSIIVGSPAADTATVTGGVSPTGTVTLNVYSGSSCGGSPIATRTMPLSSGTAGPFAVTFNATGTYNWQATYNGDGNNSPASSTCGSETLTVSKATPTVSTSLSTATIVVGNTATDTASVTGFAPTGTVTFNVYSGTICSGTPFDSKTVALSTSSSAGPVSSTFNIAGTYNWQATYNGDANNNVVSGVCGLETLSVAKATPSTTTTLSVLTVTIGNSASDTATVSGGFNPTGTVTFRVYSGTVCSGTPLAAQTVALTSNNAGPVNVIMNNTGTFNWQATYNGDGNNNVASSSCGSETLTVTRANPTATTSLSKTTATVGTPVTDTAILANGFSPTGTVAFNVYPGTVCSGAPVASITMAVSGSSAGPATASFNATGTYSWQATYNGDANNNAATSLCGSETLTVNKSSPTVSTTLSSTSIIVGNAATDSATLTGGFGSTGTVTFTIFAGPICTGTPIASRTASLTTGSAGPVSIVFNATGTYAWQATYNGDANNNVASSTCGSELLTVQKFAASITTTLTSGSVVVGNLVSDNANVLGFTPTGTVTFTVYSGTLCTGTPVASNIVALVSSSSGPVAAIFNSTGTYNWQAVYNGDSNNNPVTSTCGSETVTVTKATPSVATNLSATQIAIGGSVADTATLSGGFAPTGTVTFKVYSGTSCSGTPVATQSALFLSGSAGPVSVIFNSTGTYNWQATYGGDGNNTAAASVCGTETLSVGGALVVTTSLSSSSAVVGTPVSDTATVTGGVSPTGTVSFRVYASNICSGTSIALKTVTLVSGSAGPVSVIFNGTGTYGWRATYNGDTKNSPVSSACEPLTVTTAGPTISTLLSGSSIVVGNSVSDTATLTNGFNPTGTVVFNAYAGSVCSGTLIATRTASISGGSSGPVSVSFNSTGTYNWQATYSGDVNNSPATSPCGSETLTVVPASPSITTTLSTNTVVVGGAITDSASLSRGFLATGTVTFNLYAGSVCTGLPVATQTLSLSGSSAGPISIQLNATGSYQVLATYNGDANNNSASTTCGSETISASPSSTTISTLLSKSSSIVGDFVTDQATLSGGFRATGSVSFNVFLGTACSGTPFASNTVALSTSGTAGPVSITFTSPGAYNWQAVYSGDSNNNPATSLCGSEPLTVSKASPAVSTTLSVQSVIVGNSVSDGAVLTGGYSPTGTVTFKVYLGPSCSGTPVAAQTVSLTLNSAGPVSVIFNSTGTYNWQATYNGDGNNNISGSSCGSETLTVTKIGLSVTTSLSDVSVVVGSTVTDSASVTGGFNPIGTVTFNVYSGPICSGTPYATKTIALSTSGTAGPVSVLFNNVATYNWQAIYSGDGNNGAGSSTCGTETLLVTKSTPSVSTFLAGSSITVGNSISDSGSISGGFNPTGTVTFNVYSGTTCTGALYATSTVSLASNTAGPVSITFNAAGTYNWQAVYNGDANNNPALSTCGSEQFTVAQAVPTLATSLTKSSILVGSSVMDSATLSGGFTASGTVTFNVYSGTVCVGTPVASRTLPLSAGSAGPYSVVFNSTGTFNWQAVYNGDSNNSPAASVCGSETLTVGKATPSVTTTLSGTSIVVGNSAFDSATIAGGYGSSGTVTFSVFAGTVCSGSPLASKTFSLSSGQSGPFTVTFNSTGLFTWQATYNGDNNNNLISSPCGSETLTVQQATPSITTSLSAATIIVGNSVTDTATVSGFNPTGTVTLNVYSGTACTGTPFDTKTIALSTTGSAGPDNVFFGNAGQYTWQATYNGDSNNSPGSSTCGSESLSVSKITPAVSTTLSSSSIIVGNPASDSAAITGGLNPSGTITFKAYSGSSCLGTPIATRSLPLTGTTAGPLTVTFNASGTVNWQATYNGDSNNNAASSVCGSETLTVGKASPSITTTLSTTAIQIMHSVSDTANVAGGYGPLGTVTFTVYSGTVCSGSGVAAKTVALTSGVAGPVTVQLNVTGVYNWVAVYNGDGNNNGVSSACGSETVSVGGAIAVSTTLSSPSVVVGNSVSDTASISGGVSPTGTVTFNLYLSTCSGPFLGTKTVPLVSVSAGPVSFKFNSTATYGWLATYNGDSNNNAASGACEVLSVIKASPTLVTALSASTIVVGGSLTDSAVLNGFYNAGGTVTYQFFSGPSCSGTPTTVGAPVVVNNGIVPDSTSQSFGSSGAYSWNAVYSGDSDNSGVPSQCEPLTVTKTNPVLTTALSSNAISAGSSTYDTANLGGSFSATGTVTYEYFSGSICSGISTVIGTQVTVTGGGVPSSMPQTFNQAGSFSWDAVYSGDANNNSVSSACETLSVAPANTAISTSLSATQIIVGGTAFDSATLSGETASASGTVTYKLYQAAGCSGTATTISTVTVTASVIPNSAAHSFTLAGSYSWQAVYSGDANNNGNTSPCEPLQVGKTNTIITTKLSANQTLVGSSITDSALLTGTTNAGGSVTYELFMGSACAGTPNTVGNAVTVTAGIVPASSPQTLSSAGSYSLNAIYSGDTNNNASTSACEPLTVNKATPSLSTTLSKSTITAGGSLKQSASMTGGFQAGGTLTYQYFASSTCVGTPTSIGSPVSVSNGLIPDSVPQTFATAGAFGLSATYSGDINNAPASGMCQVLTVFAPPTLSLPGTSQTVSAGQTIHFLVNATGAGGCNQVQLSAPNLPEGASFVSTLCFAGSASSIFSWTPLASQAGDYKINFTATDSHGSVSTSQMTIHVTAPSPSAQLPLLSYSIFGLVGFLAVLGVALVLRRFQTPRNKSKA